MLSQAPCFLFFMLIFTQFFILSLKGIRPELKLKTSDGATLLHTDPVTLILSLTEENLIHSEILDWKLPSLSKRYLEACSEMKCCEYAWDVKKCHRVS